MTILQVLTAEGHGGHAAAVDAPIQPAIWLRAEKLADRPPNPSAGDDEGDDPAASDPAASDDAETPAVASPAPTAEEVAAAAATAEAEAAARAVDELRTTARFPSIEAGLASLPLGASRFGGIPDLLLPW